MTISTIAFGATGAGVWPDMIRWANRRCRMGDILVISNKAIHEARRSAAQDYLMSNKVVLDFVTPQWIQKQPWPITYQLDHRLTLVDILGGPHLKLMGIVHKMRQEAIVRCRPEDIAPILKEISGITIQKLGFR